MVSQCDLITLPLQAMSTAAWLTLPISTLNLYLSQRFPFSLGVLLDFGLGFLGAMGLLSYGYGYLKQHQVKICSVSLKLSRDLDNLMIWWQVRRYSWPRLLLVVPEIVLSTALSIVVENCAVFAMWFGRWDQVGRLLNNLNLVLCELANGFHLSILITRLNPDGLIWTSKLFLQE